jgi:arylsulfatase A-like enzyme
MIAASNAMIYAVLAILAALAAWRRPGTKTARAIPAVLVALAAFGLLQNGPALALPAQAILACGIGAWGSRLVGADPLRFERLVARTLPGLALMAIALYVVPLARERWAEERTLAALPPAPAGAPNVIWIVLDTVRADATSLVEASGRSTPTLAALGARGIVFEEARSPAGWTLPSHTSMFTGHWPRALYSESNRAKGYPPRRLEERFTTIAEHLRNHGYATAGFVANTYFCNAWYGLAQGFSRYEDAPTDWRTILRSSGLGRRLMLAVGNPPQERDDAAFSRRDAATIHAEALDWLDQRSSPDRPFFLFLNHFDAHDPYLSDCADVARQEQVWLQRWHACPKSDLPGERVRRARERYDACVEALDRRLGELISELDRRGALANTLLIVTSDHGELFGERGAFLHGPDLHREATHVPLVIVPPGTAALAGRRIAEPVSLRELPATIADLTGTDPAGVAFPGRSLARFWRAGSEARSDPVYCDTGGRADPRGTRRVPCALVAEGFAYLRGGDGREELYDRRTDPAETVNLADQPALAERLARMRALVVAIESDGEPSAAPGSAP